MRGQHRPWPLGANLGAAQHRPGCNSLTCTRTSHPQVGWHPIPREVPHIWGCPGTPAAPLLAGVVGWTLPGCPIGDSRTTGTPAACRQHITLHFRWTSRKWVCFSEQRQRKEGRGFGGVLFFWASSFLPFYSSYPSPSLQRRRNSLVGKKGWDKGT